MSRQAEILAELDAIEAREGIAILLAIESGSRAWGFESPDSDWDVRFLYARPTVWHVTLRPGRDVLEFPISDELDISGWDARKAINLLLGGNWVVREWLRSPITYRAEPGFRSALEALAAALPSRVAAFHHYRSLMDRVWKQWLADREEVVLKKYLYALRPALTLRWLRERADDPPMDMPALRRGLLLATAEAAALDALLAAKSASSEMGLGPRFPALDALIAAEREREPPPREDPPAPAMLAQAEALFRQGTGIADARPSRR
ncbi:DNA polymerase beta superfamily protein [Muricoccus radiodurans]|uniref:DNA polymerase beta superfamily protein n=1 Tax=Muricoccus radiodurans TaxID=2231721 RepID=UPI003CF7D629